MFFLLLTILTSAMISVIMRYSQGKCAEKYSMFAFNYITCIILSGFSMEWKLVHFGSVDANITLILGVLNGIFYLLGLFLMQTNIKRNGVVLTSVFSRLGGLLVPLVVAICVFKESPTLMQIIGTIVAVYSIILINYDKNSKKVNAIWLLFLVFLSDGCTTTMAKVFDELGKSELKSNYLCYTFITAFLLCVILIIHNKERITSASVFFGVLIGVPNFFASRFILKALERLPAVIVYPTRGVGGIVAISLAGILLFKEKLKKTQWIAIGTILVAIILLTIN